ncbi:hypothetical protein Landi51_13936, partial [Colletotrichum acutatum]
LNLHLLNDYCPGPTLEPWRLAGQTLDSLLESNGWVNIDDGVHPERAYLAIGRVFHNGHRVLQRPGSDAEYQGIIVVGAVATHRKLARLREVDWIILHEDVTAMLECITILDGICHSQVVTFFPRALGSDSLNLAAVR